MIVKQEYAVAVGDLVQLDPRRLPANVVFIKLVAYENGEWVYVRVDESWLGIVIDFSKFKSVDCYSVYWFDTCKTYPFSVDSIYRWLQLIQRPEASRS